MSMQSYEVRSEEEGVGNLLLVVLSDNSISDEYALKTLWVEEQEFHKDTSTEIIDSLYEREQETFERIEISDATFDCKLQELFALMETCKDQLIEIPSRSLIQMKEYFSENTPCSKRILVLESSLSGYGAYISKDRTKALFSWTDVT